MKKTLITGAAGFLGSHLVKRFLNEGHYVIGMDNLITGSLKNIDEFRQNENFEFRNHDVSKFVDIEGDLDYILHFASPASPIDYLKIPIQTLKVSSYGAHNLLGLAKVKGARIIVASTSEVYGDPEIHPQPETYKGNVNPIGIRACYDEGKRCAETLFFDYHREKNVDIRVARIFNTYGPRMLPDDGRVVSNFIVQAIKGENITIYGDGKQTRSFCYVDELVYGLIKLMDHPNFTGPVNIGNPGEFTILELAETILKKTNSTSKTVSYTHLTLPTILLV